MPVLLSDAFDDVENTLLTARGYSSWGASNAMKVIANACHSGGYAGTYTYPAAGTGHTTMYAQYARTSIPSSGMGPVVRASVDGTRVNGYQLTCTATQVRLTRLATAGNVVIANYTGTVNVGTVVRIEVEGTTIRAYIGGVLKGTATNQTHYTSGGIGIVNQAIGVYSIDTAEWGTFGVVATFFPLGLLASDSGD